MGWDDDGGHRKMRIRGWSGRETNTQRSSLFFERVAVAFKAPFKAVT